MKNLGGFQREILAALRMTKIFFGLFFDMRCSPTCDNFQASFLTSGEWRRRMRSPPELVAVADGMKEYYFKGRLDTGTGFPELREKGAGPPGEATGSRSSGLAAVGTAWGIAGII